MKKLITLLLVLTGAVCTASAQRETAGTIRVAFTDPTGAWAQSHFYIYVYDSNSNDTSFPGVDVTANTKTINGATYYYRDFPIATYGTGFKVIAVNDDGYGNSRSQSENLTWCYDRSSITGDTYYSLKSEWDSEGHRKAELVNMHYIADYENSGKVMMAAQSGNSYSVTFTSVDFPKFVVANSFAFKDDGTLDFTQNSSYPENIYRPNYQNVLTFSNITKDVSDSDRAEFYRWHNAGFFDASNLEDVTLNMSFGIENWNSTTYTISPSFTRTLNASAEGYGTFSSEYDVLIPSGLTAQYASAVNATTGAITWENYPATGIKAGQGALLTGTAGQEYTFTPSSSAVAPDANYLKAIGSDYAETALPQDDGTNTNFILSKVSNHIGFYKVATGGSWVNVGTAYLQVPGTNLSRSFFMFDEDVTAVEAVKQEQKLNAEFFNLAGQRVAQPTKGLYIVNGKKVIMK